MSQDGRFTVEKMQLLLDEEKPNQTPRLEVSMNRLKPILPNTLKNDREREEYIIKAVEWYDRYQKRQKDGCKVMGVFFPKSPPLTILPKKILTIITS